MDILTHETIIEKPDAYVKFCIRCLTSCLRHEIGIAKAIGDLSFFDKLVQILRKVKDEEILANACKCVRICLRDDSNLDMVVQKYKDLANILIEGLHEHGYSDAICQEILSGWRNWTKKPEYVVLIVIERVLVIM